MRLTTIETQLDAIQQKLEESLWLFMPKRGRAAHSLGESSTRMRMSVRIERGSCVLTYIYTYLYFLFVYGYSFMFWIIVIIMGWV